MDDEFVRDTEVNPDEKPDMTYHYSYISEGKDKKGAVKVIQALIILVLVFFMGLAGGYFGTMLAMKSNKSDLKSAPVFYQTVERVDDSGNKLKDLTVKDVAKLTSNSVVEIKTEVVQYSIWMSQYVTSGSGSGVVLSNDGYIVTCNHVIENANKISVRLSDGTDYDAQLIGTDADNDIAVIKVEADNLQPVVIGDSKSLEVGEQVVAIGNPLGSLGGTVTTGIISATDREITIDNLTMRLIQMDAAVNPGNSGGALFNMSGELVGIVNAKSGGSNIEGLGFAIPVTSVMDHIEDIVEKGYVSGKRLLGISIADINSRQYAMYYGVTEYGVYITDIQQGSLAESLGFEKMDRVISINGISISSSDVLKTVYGGIAANEECIFRIDRNGEEITIKFNKD